MLLSNAIRTFRERVRYSRKIHNSSQRYERGITDVLFSNTRRSRPGCGRWNKLACNIRFVDGHSYFLAAPIRMANFRVRPYNDIFHTTKRLRQSVGTCLFAKLLPSAHTCSIEFRISRSIKPSALHKPDNVYYRWPSTLNNNNNRVLWLFSRGSQTTTDVNDRSL